MRLKSLTSLASKFSGKFSLKTVLIVPFIIQIVAAVGLVGYLSFRNGQQAVEEFISLLLSEVTTHIQIHLTHHVQTPHLVNQSVRLEPFNTEDVSIREHLNNFLNSLNLSLSGNIFIIDRSGQIVAQTTFDKADNKVVPLDASQSHVPSIRTSTQHLTEQFGNLSQIKAIKQLSFDFNGQRQFLQVTPLSETIDWLIVVVVPETDFMERINENTIQTIVLSILAFFIAILVSSSTVKWIVRPIDALNKAAQQLSAQKFFTEQKTFASSGKWKQTLPVERADELGNLTKSFNRMAMQLQESFDELKKLEHIVNHSPVVTFLWRADENWSVEFVSKNVQQFGYSCDDFHSGRVLFANLVYPDDLKRVVQEVTQYSQAGVTDFTQEYRIITQTGEVRWLDDHTWIRRATDGTITHYQGIVIDITERKQAEENLRANKDRYRLLAEHATDIISRHTPDGVFLYASPACRTLLGYEPEELIGHSAYEFFHPLDLENFKLKRRSTFLASQIGYPFGYRIRRKSGEYLWFETTSQVVYDSSSGEVQEIVAISRDITERKTTEAQLEAANTELKKFKKTLDMTLDCVFMFDAQTFKFFYVNQGAINQIGYTQQELLQMTVLDISPSLTEKEARQFLAPLLEGSQPSLMHETIHQHKNTTLIQVEAFFQYIQIPPNPPFSKGGNDIAQPIQISPFSKGTAALEGTQAIRLGKGGKKESFFVAIVRDITERKRAEAKLQQAKKAADEARKAAEIANHAKTAFLANMSHELRTPLNSILGYTQILSRDKSLVGKQKEGIQIIHRSGEHLLTLINDILDLSKIEAGKLGIIPVDFCLPDLLQNIADLMKMRAEQKNIKLVYEILYPLPTTVWTDEKRLRQVLLNLLSNAIKFTDKGSVTFKVIYYCSRIRFEIEDTGYGIPADQLDAIFLPFRQIGYQSQQQEGTGLGLAISKQLVEMMGGQLQVESLVGTGSIFWFDIPLPEAQGVVDTNHTQQATIVGYKRTEKIERGKEQRINTQKKGKRGKDNEPSPTTNYPFKILVVDDKWQNRAFLVNMLTDLGFSVLEANNGKEALDLVRKNLPDLILTDLVMPVMDGFEFTRKIRQSTRLKDVVVIAASANVFEHQQRQSLFAGCNEFIAKPISTDNLLDLLQKYLPLEWIYDETDTPSTPPCQEKAKTATEARSSIKGPSPEQASALFKLVMSGNIKKIIENVTQLEQQDARLSAFADEVRKLVKSFEMSKLKELLSEQ
jgi:PAS domain S-box-containing protein